MACKTHRSLRTEAQNEFQTAYHQGLGWKWPNQTLPQAWPTSNQFNLEISVQATGAQPVRNSLIFFCYQFFQDMCPSLWELSDHVPWVRTTKFISFQKSIFIFLNGSPISFLVNMSILWLFKVHFSSMEARLPLQSLDRCEIWSFLISCRGDVEGRVLAWIKSSGLMDFLNTHSILLHSLLLNTARRAFHLPPTDLLLSVQMSWAEITQGLSRTAMTCLKTMCHFGSFQMHMSSHFPKTPLCNWMSWRGGACRNHLELEFQRLAVISWLETWMEI